MACQVMTACGPISSEALGTTDMHDHLVTGMPGWQYDATYVCDRQQIIKDCIEMVGAAKELGLASMVDATPIDLSRDPEICRQVMEETGVNIICSTGMYTEAEGNNAFFRLLSMYSSREEALKRLTDTYLLDLTRGIGATGVRAGVIKLAAGDAVVSPFEELSAIAGVTAQKETGAPIISHTGKPAVGPAFAKLLVELGANPKKTMIGHMCDTDDVDTLLETLACGVYVGIDRLGLNYIFPDEKKLQLLRALVDRGYLDRILLGVDAIISFFGGDMVSPELLASAPHYNLCGLLGYFKPRFKELGLTDEQIDTLFIDNPRRFFEGA